MTATQNVTIYGGYPAVGREATPYSDTRQPQVGDYVQVVDTAGSYLAPWVLAVVTQPGNQYLNVSWLGGVNYDREGWIAKRFRVLEAMTDDVVTLRSGAEYIDDVGTRRPVVEWGTSSGGYYRITGIDGSGNRILRACYPTGEVLAEAPALFVQPEYLRIYALARDAVFSLPINSVQASQVLVDGFFPPERADGNGGVKGVAEEPESEPTTEPEQGEEGDGDQYEPEVVDQQFALPRRGRAEAKDGTMLEAIGIGGDEYVLFDRGGKPAAVSKGLFAVDKWRPAGLLSEAAYTDRMAALALEATRNRSRVADLEQRVAEHRDWRDRLVMDAHAEANRLGWCSEFDEFMIDHGLPGRDRDWEVTLEVTVQVRTTIEASTADAARDTALETITETDLAQLISEQDSVIDGWTVQGVIEI